jgi:hypothetical protein
VRLAFLGDGSLVVAHGTILQRIGIDGASIWSLDAGPAYPIRAVAAAAAGERIAVAAGSSQDAVALLDASGAVHWAAKHRAYGVDVDASGRVVLRENGVLMLDAATGAFRWAWGFDPRAVFPPVWFTGDVAFLEGDVVAGGWFGPSLQPFLVRLDASA